MMKWLLLHIPNLSPKQREIFATFFFNLAVASIAVAAFEGKWLGVVGGVLCIAAAYVISKEL